MDTPIYLQGTNQKFRLTQTELGRGSYGEVRLAIGDDQLLYACKELKPRLGQWSYYKIDKFFKNAAKEKDSLLLCQHQNIIKFIDYIEVRTPYGFKIYIISEYCDGGTLGDITKKVGRIGEGNALPLLKGLAFGLQYLHSLKITHRNIKPANILIHGIVPKYASDFGFAKIFDEMNADENAIEVGSYQYMAPELLDESDDYDEKVDVWALGLIFYQLLIGQFPWDIEYVTSMAEVFNQLEDDCEVRFPKTVPVSDKMKEIITNMLKFEPGERYNSDQVVQELID